MTPPNSKACVYEAVRVKLVSEKMNFCSSSWDKERPRKASGQTFSWNERLTAVETHKTRKMKS